MPCLIEGLRSFPTEAIAKLLLLLILSSTRSASERMNRGYFQRQNVDIMFRFRKLTKFELSSTEAMTRERLSTGILAPSSMDP